MRCCAAFHDFHCPIRRCVECPPNKFNSAGTCVGCSPGQDRAQGLLACVMCTAGKATTGGGLPCASCEAGKFSSAIGARECSNCPVGTYRGELDDACKVCPVGFWCGEGAVEPQKCVSGRFGDQEGRSDDQCSGACAAGYVCPAGSRSRVETGLLPQCKEGYYLERNSSGYEACVPCDAAKMDCALEGQVVETLAVRPGMWRQTNASAARWIQPCFNPAACIGSITLQGTDANGTIAARRRLSTGRTSYGDGLCADGQTGKFCGVCKPGFFGGSKTATCTACKHLRTHELPTLAIRVTSCTFNARTHAISSALGA